MGCNLMACFVGPLDDLTIGWVQDTTIVISIDKEGGLDPMLLKGIEKTSSVNVWTIIKSHSQLWEWEKGVEEKEREGGRGNELLHLIRRCVEREVGEQLQSSHTGHVPY